MARRKRPDRLRGRAQFEAVLAHFSAIGRGRYFIVRVAPCARDGARLGIIASRKAIRRAVDRSTCKRIVREAFRQYATDLAGLDVVVVCRTVVRRSQRPQAWDELRRILPRLAAAKEPPEDRGAASGGADDAR